MENNTNYSAVISECSAELSVRERIKLKDTSEAIRLDEATKVDALLITPAYHAILHIHNEKSESKEYNVYVIVDTDGQKYITGSESFWNSYINIYEEMEEETEPWSIKAYRKASKNRPGKDFITCSLA